MKLFGSLTELVSLIFRKNSQAITVRPNQATTYTAARDIQLPEGDTAHVVVSRTSTDTLTNKSISGSVNTITNISLTAGVTGVLPTANGGTGQNSTATFPTSGTLVTEAGSATLTNKTIDGDNNTVQDLPETAIKTNLTNASKFFTRDASGVPESATKVVPTGAVVGTSDSQTLTNKTISGASNTITNVSLTSGVTGTLPIANGGTGQTSQTDAFDALAPSTTKGDLIVHNGTDNIRVAVGTNDFILTADSTQASGVKWAANSGSSQATATTLGTVKGGTVPGDISGNAIAAGYIGERVSSAQTNIGGIPQGGYATVQSITVTAGVWDINCVVKIPSTASLISIYFGIATVTNTNTGHVLGDTATAAVTISGQDAGGALAGIRKIVTSSTTYYLTVRPFGADITGGFDCRITAVRVG